MRPVTDRDFNKIYQCLLNPVSLRHLDRDHHLVIVDETLRLIVRAKKGAIVEVLDIYHAMEMKENDDSSGNAQARE